MSVLELERPLALDAVQVNEAKLLNLAGTKEPLNLLQVESEVKSLAVTEITNEVSYKEQKLWGMTFPQVANGAAAVATVELVASNPRLMSVAVLGSLMRLAYPQLKKLKLGKKKLNLHLTTLMGVSLTAVAGLSLYEAPAQALFFDAAETFFTQTFPLAATPITTLFNIFRAVYVIYLIYSAISIWTSYNRDEEWMSVAKGPIVVFVGGTMIDLLTTMITA